MKRRRRKPEGLVEVSQLLDGALKKLGAKGAWDRSRLEGKCREWLGPASAMLERAEERKGTVTLYFRHGALLQEFNYRRAECLAMLKETFPRLGIRDVKAALAGGGRKRDKDPNG